MGGEARWKYIPVIFITAAPSRMRYIATYRLRKSLELSEKRPRRTHGNERHSVQTPRANRRGTRMPDMVPTTRSDRSRKVQVATCFLSPQPRCCPVNRALGDRTELFRHVAPDTRLLRTGGNAKSRP